MSILYISACARKESRTKLLADHLISLMGGSANLLDLYQTEIPLLDEAALDRRDRAAREEDLDNPFVKLAVQFRDADEIVIAAPYWDLSFPAVLKSYLEAVMTQGITFTYTEKGIPMGLCHAKKLYYVTTCGGPVIEPELGFAYIESLAGNMFGIRDIQCYRAEGLDIWGADVETILNQVKAKMKADFEKV